MYTSEGNFIVPVPFAAELNVMQISSATFNNTFYSSKIQYSMTEH
jgi:hypothetical protein